MINKCHAEIINQLARSSFRDWFLKQWEIHLPPQLSSGNLLHEYGKSPFIVDLPIKNCDLPWFFVNVYQRVGGFNAGVMGPNGTWSDWWRPLRWGFRGFIMCLKGRKKAGTWITHSHAVVCYSNIIMYTICFNIVMERFTMLLSSVNHIFLWAIEKPWLCNK
jgi:hypothetical protein